MTAIQEVSAGLEVVSLTLVAPTRERALAFTRDLADALGDGSEAGLGLVPNARPEVPSGPDFTISAWARVSARRHRDALALVELAAGQLGVRVDRHEVLDLLVITLLAT